ncbi:MAG: hypothetical protein ACRD68_17490, partial [Pyrinomonadaceae bacterium]
MKKRVTSLRTNGPVRLSVARKVGLPVVVGVCTLLVGWLMASGAGAQDAYTGQWAVEFEPGKDTVHMSLQRRTERGGFHN